MIGIHFSKERAEEVMQALSSGQSLRPPTEEGWTAEDLLIIAGACFAMRLGLGPDDDEDGAEAPEEMDDEAVAQLYDEVHAAIEWNGRMTMRVQEGTYDEEFEAEHMAMMRVERDGDVEIQPISGFKESEGDEER